MRDVCIYKFNVHCRLFAYAFLRPQEKESFSPQKKISTLFLHFSMIVECVYT